MTKDFTHGFNGMEISSDELRMQSYKLRYDVFCNELNFLNVEDYPDGMESDKNDSLSGHFAVFDSAMAGYVRLISSDNGLFPFNRHQFVLLPDIELPSVMESAEISRLIIRSDLRSVKESYLVQLALYKQMYMYSVNKGIRFWYATMESGLARSLARMGFDFRRITEDMVYFRPAVPYLADLRELESVLMVKNPDLLEWFSN